MKRRSGRRGLTLVEIMVGVFLLGLTVLTALAIFPLSALLKDRSGSFSRASVVAQRKVEQIRQLDPSIVTAAGLRSNGIVDASTAPSGALSFTATDQLASEFRGGAGEVALTPTGTDLVRVDVTLTWQSHRGHQNRVQTMTYVADKAAWREP